MKEFILVTIVLLSVSLLQKLIIPNPYEGNLYSLKLKGKIKSIERHSFRWENPEGELKEYISNSDYYLFHLMPPKDYAINYDRNGLKETMKIFKSNYNRERKLQYDFEYSYNNKQQITYEKRTNSNGTLFHELNYTYQNDSNITKVELDEMDSSSSLMMTTQYHYNNKKQLTKQVSIDPSGQIRYYWNYTPDKNGNIVYEERIVNKKKKESFEKKYNSGNQIIERLEYNKEEKLIKKITYNYNDKDDLILVNIYLPDNLNTPYDKIEYEYEYDTSGNWIKNTIRKNAGIRYILERDLKYY